MIPGRLHHRRHMLDGTLRVFLAEFLIVPTGLLVTAFLTRRLGVSGYGLFTLAVTFVTWIEWSVTSVFARATIKFSAEATDWRPVGAAMVRLNLLAGMGAAGLLWLLAPALGRLMHEEALVLYLRLLAFEIPLFTLSQAHRNLLVGIGRFRERAMVTAGRWLARLLLIVLLVAAGLSIRGALLGSIGASVVEVALCRYYVRPPWLGPASLPARQIWSYATPLFLAAAAARLYDKIDLFALKGLGGTARQAGIYAAAQNLALIPAVFALAFTPLLLSTLTGLFAAEDGDGVRAMSRDALRVVLWLLPLAGMTAGAAPEILDWIFGRPFRPAAPLLAWLSFGAVALVMVSVAATIVTAAGRPGWAFGLTGPLVPLALAGHLALIPRWGPAGAAAVTATVAGLGAAAAVITVRRCCRVLPPAGTAARSLLISGAAAAGAALCPAPGVLLLLKLPAITLASGGLFFLLGEFGPSEIAGARALLRPSSRTPENARA